MLCFGHDVCRLEQNAPVFVDPHQEPRIRLTWEDSTASRVSFDNRRFHAAILPPIFPQWEKCAVKRSAAISPLLSPEQQVRTRRVGALHPVPFGHLVVGTEQIGPVLARLEDTSR